MKSRSNISSRINKAIALLLAVVFVFILGTQVVHHHHHHAEEQGQSFDHKKHLSVSDKCHVCDFVTHKQSHFALYFDALNFSFFQPEFFISFHKEIISFYTLTPDTSANRGPPTV